MSTFIALLSTTTSRQSAGFVAAPRKASSRFLTALLTALSAWSA